MAARRKRAPTPPKDAAICAYCGRLATFGRYDRRPDGSAIHRSHLKDHSRADLGLIEPPPTPWTPGKPFDEKASDRRFGRWLAKQKEPVKI